MPCRVLTGKWPAMLDIAKAQGILLCYGGLFEVETGSLLRGPFSMACLLHMVTAQNRSCMEFLRSR